MYKIDLNCDLGESFGAYTIGCDNEVLPFITSANIACGFHASDPIVMERTVAAAAVAGTACGAHPGFPDLMGFGRREMKISPNEAKAYVLYQIGALASFAKEAQVKLQHVKPHGALYNMAVKDYDLAKAICVGVASFDRDLILLAPANSELIHAAKDCGLRTACEVFADRAYEEDGSLVSRKKQGAMITDEQIAVQRVIQMITKGTVTSITGKEIAVHADSVCVHGDNTKALTFIKSLRKAFDENEITVCNLEKIF
jgi:UPF0271 protein